MQGQHHHHHQWKNNRTLRRRNRPVFLASIAQRRSSFVVDARITTKEYTRTLAYGSIVLSAGMASSRRSHARIIKMRTVSAFEHQKLSIWLVSNGAVPLKFNDGTRVKITKCSNSLWKLTCYATVQACILTIAYHESWFKNTREYFRCWANQELKLPLKLFSVCPCGFYLYSFLALFKWETQRKDFSVMMSHHVVTVFLIGCSYITGYGPFNTMLVTRLAFHTYCWIHICSIITRELKNRGKVREDIRSAASEFSIRWESSAFVRTMANPPVSAQEIYEYPIHIQDLFYFALRCAPRMLKLERDDRKLIEQIDKRIPALNSHIQIKYRLALTQLNDIYYITEEYSCTGLKKFNVIPEYIVCVLDFMTESGGYLIGNVSPAHVDFRLFLVGNCIPILSSLATPAQSIAIMDLIEGRWEDLIGEMTLTIAYPAFEERQWKILTTCDLEEYSV